MHRGLFITLLMIVAALSVHGQVVPDTNVEKHTVVGNTDSVNRTIVAEHSANKALLLSLLPGAGQVYNGQAWKLPIIYGAFAGVGYFIYNNYTNMKAFKDEYLLRIEGGLPQMEGYTSYPNSSIYNLYQSYNKNFQLFIIIGAVVYGLNLVDAYVFGHLYDFQINDDLSMRMEPSLMPDITKATGFSPSLKLSFTF